ncbi:hypothetical protein PI124_g5824 [Phytophthora idaei]|nr:hypothetical protein PI126_g12353 [Phytophthora idaei]KAG3249535.1 hypothetical protein PI124_g5824 [Phytophthora idaei]
MREKDCNKSHNTDQCQGDHRAKEVKLFCVVIDEEEEEDSFPIDINENRFMSELKNAIKAELSCYIKYATKDLRIYMAKKNSVKWMSDDDVNGPPQGLTSLKPHCKIKDALLFEKFSKGNHAESTFWRRYL